jgi:uncharacterized protein YuzB (UPF0349 family)
MQNQKVYLAKSNLASGLDFEYVKSSLLRIPNIEIIEYGDGYEPSDCTCVVYVHDNTTLVQEEHILTINKNIFSSVEEFITTNGDEEAINGIFIYLGKSYSSPRDVESTTPFMVPAAGYLATEDTSSWDEHGILTIEATEGICLLESVSYAMDNRNITSWEQNPRHDQPEDKYAMPPIPSLAERKSKGTKRISTSNKDVTKTSVRKSANIVSPVRHISKIDDKVKELTNHDYEEENEKEEYAGPTVINGISADDIIASRKPKRRF